jgi:hypothetical protein
MARIPVRRTWAVASLAAAALLAPGTAQADPAGLTRIFTDPFTNATSQHATTVEPDTFAAGSTLVTVTQSGRFFDGGGSDIGFATSTNGGQTWSSGTLPAIVGRHAGGPTGLRRRAGAQRGAAPRQPRFGGLSPPLSPRVRIRTRRERCRRAGV